jgi:hypothetical protein
MIQTLNTKCESRGCSHGVEDSLLRRMAFGEKTTKWHQCKFCGAWQVAQWIDRHTMHCESFTQSKWGCDQLGHTHAGACGAGHKYFSENYGVSA